MEKIRETDMVENGKKKNRMGNNLFQNLERDVTEQFKRICNQEMKEYIYTHIYIYIYIYTHAHTHTSCETCIWIFFISLEKDKT